MNRGTLRFSITQPFLAGRVAEQELGAVIYPIEVIRAPVFLDVLQDYYLGGINDMAAWTQIVWDTSIEMAKYGPENCHIETNPMNIYCNGSSTGFSERFQLDSKKERKVHFFDHLKTDLGISDFCSNLILIMSLHIMKLI